MKALERYRLPLLALLLSLLWFGSGAVGALDSRSRSLWDRVREGQQALWGEQIRRGIPLSEQEDKLKTGFIGVEWSPLTTTLGDLSAKRTACNPLWVLQYGEWFDQLELKSGDRVAIYSSASFPGLLYSALVAAEQRNLDILLAVSLGASTWGANRPEFPWPLMAQTLHERGFIKTRATFYTLGGGEERGIGLSNQTLALFERLATEQGVPLLRGESGEEMIRIKKEAIRAFDPALLISIGGGYANMGESDAILLLPPGLLLPRRTDASHIGDGVIGETLRAGIPVLHLLNLARLSRETGIPWDADSFLPARVGERPFLSVMGVVCCLFILLTHRRWDWGG